MEPDQIVFSHDETIAARTLLAFFQQQNMSRNDALCEAINWVMANRGRFSTERNKYVLEGIGSVTPMIVHGRLADVGTGPAGIVLTFK